MTLLCVIGRADLAPTRAACYRADTMVCPYKHIIPLPCGGEYCAFRALKSTIYVNQRDLRESLEHVQFLPPLPVILSASEESLKLNLDDTKGHDQQE